MPGVYCYAPNEQMSIVVGMCHVRHDGRVRRFECLPEVTSADSCRVPALLIDRALVCVNSMAGDAACPDCARGLSVSPRVRGRCDVRPATTDVCASCVGRVCVAVGSLGDGRTRGHRFSYALAVLRVGPLAVPYD